MKSLVTSESGDGVLKEVLLSDLSPWDQQPRKNFDNEKHKQLVHSVMERGVIQPLLIRAIPGEPGFQIIAGERRYRAALEAGKKTVLCVLRQLSDAQALELALVENLDREDLDVFEEAEGYQGLIGLGYTVIELAEKFGKNREFIYARLDVIALDEEARSAVREGSLALAAARELAKVCQEDRAKALDEVLHPAYSELPMSRDKAVAYLKSKFVDPAAKSATWSEGMGALQKQFPEANICEYAEGKAMQQHGSGWVRVGDFPQDWEVVERLRGDGKELPCWGDLAEKYGAQISIVPTFGGEEILSMVERKVVIDGDIVNAPAGECVFPKPRGENEEKEEKSAQLKRKEAAAALAEAKKKEVKGFLEELRTAGIEGVLPALVASKLHENGGLIDVYNVMHGASLGAYNDADWEILDKWVLALIKKGGLKSWLWLQAAEELVGDYHSDGFTYSQVADAAGMRRSDWPALCNAQVEARRD